MGNSKIPAYSGGCCGHEHLPVVRTISAPIKVVDYEHLLNKPQINGVELVANKTFEDLGLDAEVEEIIEELGFDICSDQDIDDLFNN